jgi:hypothetical protein
MKKLWLFLSCVYVFSGCSHISQADYAQSADVATTAIGLSNGLSEANTIWGDASWPVMGVVKLGVTQLVKLTPQPYCTSGLMGLTLAGYGAALWNIGVMLGSGPAAIPVAVGVLGWQWDYLMADATVTCVPDKSVAKISRFNSDREPYSYSGPTCQGWDNARPDFCNDYYQKIKE